MSHVVGFRLQFPTSQLDVAKSYTLHFIMYYEEQAISEKKNH